MKTLSLKETLINGSSPGCKPVLTKWDLVNLSPISLTLFKVRITLSFVAEKTKKTKVIQNFMDNHILFYNFPEKLAEKSYSTF